MRASDWPSGRPERTSDSMPSTTDFSDRDAPDQSLNRRHLVGRHHLLGDGLLDTGGLEKHPAFGFEVGISDVDLEEKPVELGFGERVGALLLKRILGGQNVERRRQVVSDAGDGNMVLLHGLEQRRLGSRTGPIDLVGHQQLGENRTVHETECAATVGRLVHDFRSGDVGGHQIGGELNAFLRQTEDGSKGLNQFCLGQSGNADQQTVSPGKQRGKDPLGHRFLAVDDLTYGFARGLDPGHCGVGLFDNRVRVGWCRWGHDAHIGELYFRSE